MLGENEKRYTEIGTSVSDKSGAGAQQSGQVKGCSCMIVRETDGTFEAGPQLTFHPPPPFLHCPALTPT